MKFQDFLTKWNGKPVDTDNAYGAQCMDLMHQYCVEVLGLSQADLAADPAKLVYLNFPTITGHAFFEQIPNSPSAVPQEGDIVFWDGTYGHVAIFIEGDTNSFRSFDQNYPTGSPCHVQNHNYDTPKVLGWLRYKITNSVMVSVESSVFENLVRKSTIYDAIFTRLNVQDSQTIVLAEIDKLVGYEDAVGQKDQQVAEAQATIKSLRQTAADKEVELKTLQEDMDALKLKNQTDMDALTKRVDKAVTQNKDLQIKLKEAQDAAQMPILTGWKKWLFDTFIK